MASTPDGKGYWLVASDGGIFTFGDANFYGSTGALALNKPIVGMASTPTARATGWWPQTGHLHLWRRQLLRLHRRSCSEQAHRRDGIDPDGKGYWLVASDGGIFTFGDANFYGSTGALALNKPIVGMASTPTARLLAVASDGASSPLATRPLMDRPHEIGMHMTTWMIWPPAQSP